MNRLRVLEGIELTGTLGLLKHEGMFPTEDIENSVACLTGEVSDNTQRAALGLQFENDHSVWHLNYEVTLKTAASLGATDTKLK